MPSNQNKVCLLDTNIFLRFITNDHPQLSQRAKNIFKSAESGKYKIYLDELVLGEVVWTLQSFYEYSRSEIYKHLSRLITSKFIINPRKNILVKALNHYSVSSLSFSDCWISEVAKSNRIRLQTFDKALQKLT